MSFTISVKSIWFSRVQHIGMCILCYSPDGKECGCNHYIQDQEYIDNFNKEVIRQLRMCGGIYGFSNNKKTIIFPNITTQERDQMIQYFMHDWNFNSDNEDDAIDALVEFITSGIELRT